LKVVCRPLLSAPRVPAQLLGPPLSLPSQDLTGAGRVGIALGDVAGSGWSAPFRNKSDQAEPGQHHGVGVGFGNRRETHIHVEGTMIVAILSAGALKAPTVDHAEIQIRCRWRRGEAQKRTGGIVKAAPAIADIENLVELRRERCRRTGIEGQCGRSGGAEGIGGWLRSPAVRHIPGVIAGMTKDGIDAGGAENVHAGQ
jgi:hypothetical protein